MSKKASDALTGANMCIGHSGLTAVAAATTLTHLAVQAAFNGRSFAIAAATAQASPTTDVTTKKAFLPLSANQACTFVVGVDKTGARFVAQGPIENDPAGDVALEMAGSIPETVCPIGFLVVRAGPTAVGTWTYSTNNFSGVTGVVVTAQSVAWLPSAPAWITN